MFDQMIQEVAQRFGLGDKAGSLVQSVVGMMTDEMSGGLPGFLSAFDEGGMGSAVRSWVGKGANDEIDASQVESALGDGAIADLARKFGLDRGIVGGALAFLISRVVDLLTPDGNVPSSASLMGRLGGFLGVAGAAVAGTGAAAGRAAEGAVEDTAQMAGAAAGRAGDAVRGVAGGAQRMAGGTVDEVGQAARKGGGMLKWLFLLLIAALALWWFAESCQPQSADLGVGENAETTEMVSIRGYGSAQPVTSNDTEEGRFRNRRIGYTVLA